MISSGLLLGPGTSNLAHIQWHVFVFLSVASIYSHDRKGVGLIGSIIDSNESEWARLTSVSVGTPRIILHSSILSQGNDIQNLSVGPNNPAVTPTLLSTRDLFYMMNISNFVPVKWYLSHYLSFFVPFFTADIPIAPPNRFHMTTEIISMETQIRICWRKLERACTPGSHLAVQNVLCLLQMITLTRTLCFPTAI